MIQSYTKIILKKEFDQIFASGTTTGTVLTALQNRISAIKTVETSINTGAGIPTDFTSRAILDRAFEAKIGEVEAGQIASELSTVIANFKATQTGVQNQDDIR